MDHNSLVYQSSSSTEAVIKRTIEGIQRMISINNSQAQKEEEKGDNSAVKINPVMKKHWESEIKILQGAPRDADKLREILKAKQEEYEEAADSEDIERLVPEIEMLKFVLFLVSRNKDREVNNAS
jgi:hypothetical protein